MISCNIPDETFAKSRCISQKLLVFLVTDIYVFCLTSKGTLINLHKFVWDTYYSLSKTMSSVPCYI